MPSNTNDSANKALLPAGLRDVLPPEAAFESDVVSTLIACFVSHGYARVRPPLIEFEESLLGAAGAATASETFRLMDPVSQRMMGLRSDITVQVARIATTRLGNAPRPLRLCYAGQVLRVKGTQLRPERQFGQAGVELIGSDAVAADAELVMLAVEALEDLGLGGLSVDLNMPTLVPAVCAEFGIGDGVPSRLRAALDHKDATAVAAEGGEAASTLGALLEAAGPAEKALAALHGLALPGAAAAERDRLTEGVEHLRGQAPAIKLTIDPVEHRGFEYHTGMCFTLFAGTVHGELGRGGRYLAGADVNDSGGESATGFTLFMDTVLRALPRPEAARRLFLPAGTPASEGARLRGDGWVTVSGLDEVADVPAEARRLECSHALVQGKIVSVT
jgi:ATP phosphoribosyltransferase regulatory subunit